jgi:hypothetical protein
MQHSGKPYVVRLCRHDIDVRPPIWMGTFGRYPRTAASANIQNKEKLDVFWEVRRASSNGWGPIRSE